MNLQAALEQRERVQAFMQVHRTGLLTLVFAEWTSSITAGSEPENPDSLASLQAHAVAVKRILDQFPEAAEITRSNRNYFIVFTKPSDAVRFTLLLQSAGRPVAGSPSSDSIRTGIHMGEILPESKTSAQRDLYQIQVDVATRLLFLAKAGQILLTRPVFDNARQVLKGEELEGIGPLRWLSHGWYAISGIEEPLEMCEVGELGKACLAPPLESEKAKRHGGLGGEPVLGWRPAIGQPVPNTEWSLVSKLGEGGFGEVWLGRHKRSGEERVFKFCFRADRVRTLKREVTIWKILKEKLGEHPNIVPVREVYFEEPPYYLVMDYAAGEDLQSWSERRGGLAQIPLATRLEVAAQVAEALGAAHSAGVLHRDVKPSNILVREEDSRVQVRLTDFGIGELLAKETAGKPREGFTQTVMGGAGAGSRLYMAPELWVGRAASKVSDMYSLGVVIYQLIVGHLSEPLTPDWEERVDEPLLRQFLSRLIVGIPEQRFNDALAASHEMRQLEKDFREDSQRSRLVAWTRFKFKVQYVGGLGLLSLGFWGILDLLLGILPLVPNASVKFIFWALFLTVLGMGLLPLSMAIFRFQWGWITLLASLFCLGVMDTLLMYWGSDPDALNPIAMGIVAGTVPLCLSAFVGYPTWKSHRENQQRQKASLGKRLWAKVERSLIDRSLMAFGLILTFLIAIFYGIENWRGKARWEKHVRELKASGYATSLKELIPAKVTDELNFCKAPGMPGLIGGVTFSRWYFELYPGSSLPPYGTNDAVEGMKAAKLEEAKFLPWAVLKPAYNQAVLAVNLVDLSFTNLVIQLAGLAGVRLDIEPELAKAFQYTSSRFSVVATNQTPFILLTNFLAHHACALRRVVTNGVAQIGLRPSSAQAILDWYESWEPQIRDLYGASQRPFAVLLIHGPYDCETPIPNFVRIRDIAQNLVIHATASLLLGQPDRASADLRVISKIMRSLESDPTLVGAMIETAIAGLSIKVVADGLKEGAWLDNHLLIIQDLYQNVNLIKRVQYSFGCERLIITDYLLDNRYREMLAQRLAFSYPKKRSHDTQEAVGGLFFYFYDIIPRGWIYQNACEYSGYFKLIQDSININKKMLYEIENIIFPPYTYLLIALNVVSEVDFKDGFWKYAWQLIRDSRNSWLPNYVRASDKAAQNQTLLNQAIIACGLERFKLANRAYPSRLAELMPKYLPNMPIDVNTDREMIYRRTENGKYILYATGLDRRDDGGIGSGNGDDKDWVWTGVPQ